MVTSRKRKDGAFCHRLFERIRRLPIAARSRERTADLGVIRVGVEGDLFSTGRTRTREARFDSRMVNDGRVPTVTSERNLCGLRGQFSPLFQLCGDGCELSVQLGPEAVDNGDYGDCDTGGDQAIFNCCGTRFVLQEPSQNPHGSGPFDRPIKSTVVA